MREETRKNTIKEEEKKNNKNRIDGTCSDGNESGVGSGGGKSSLSRKSEIAYDGEM